MKLDASVHHHHVEAPELGDGSGHRFVNVALLRHVAGDDERTSAGRSDLLSQLLDGHCVAIHQGDGATLGGDSAGSRLADPAAGSGDEDIPSVESQRSLLSSGVALAGL
jgi:hypothetical protein